MSSNAGDQTGRETAVLIHGLSDSRAVWWRQQDGLSADMDVVAYDVRGFGTSPAGGGLGTVAQLADDLAQIVSAQVAGPAWLIGFSMGGVIAQQFALDFPQLTRGLVLIGSSCTIGRAGIEFFDKRIEEVSGGGLDSLAQISVGDARGCLASDDPELLAEYHRIRSTSVRDKAGYLNACYAMRALSDNKLTEQLPNIDCPALVIAPELDPYCPPKASKMIADAIPGAQMQIVEGAGHCVHMEKPDTVNQLVRDFVAAHPAS